MARAKAYLWIEIILGLFSLRERGVSEMFRLR